LCIRFVTNNGFLETDNFGVDRTRVRFYPVYRDFLSIAVSNPTLSAIFSVLEIQILLAAAHGLNRHYEQAERALQK
jgi:hypothetical protein